MGGQLDEVQLWRSLADGWKRVQRSAEKNLTRADLTVAELRILRLLGEQGSLPMHRFCPETMLSQPTITGIIDKLEERGLVARVRSKEDRREVLIAITAKGSDAYARGLETHREFVKKALLALSSDEVDTLASLLKRLADASDSLVTGQEMATVQ